MLFFIGGHPNRASKDGDYRNAIAAIDRLNQPELVRKVAAENSTGTVRNYDALQRLKQLEATRHQSR